MQKFNAFDLVQIADELGEFMSHFKSGCRAIVIGSYADQYGGDERDKFTVHIEAHGQHSWYYAGQMELIETDRRDLLEQWQEAERLEAEQCGDLDWIFAHGHQVLENAHGASLSALGSPLGIGNLWPSGEGFEYYQNAMIILGFAEPYLEAGDRAGYEEAAEFFRTELSKGAL